MSGAAGEARTLWILVAMYHLQPSGLPLDEAKRRALPEGRRVLLDFLRERQVDLVLLQSQQEELEEGLFNG